MLLNPKLLEERLVNLWDGEKSATMKVLYSPESKKRYVRIQNILLSWDELRDLATQLENL